MQNRPKIARMLVKPSNLHLDLHNPRFGLEDAADEPAARVLLAERANLKELWDSINSQGWIDFEPLVAIPSNQPDHYTVIEGNRRLAAVQTLINPSTLPDRLRKRVPIASPLALSSTAEINVAIVSDRRDADAYIGFKHVNGPASWGPLAKAKFASDMFFREKDAGLTSEDALQKTTQALGDTSNSMLRILVAYQVFQQSLLEQILDVDVENSRTFDFSHLYTMMPNPATREFLGLGADPLRASSITVNPIPGDHIDALAYLMGWLFGTSQVPQVIKRQGTDRPKLQKVLAQESALETLIATNDLDASSVKAGVDVDRWRSGLIRAETDAKRLATDLTDIQDRLEASQVSDAIVRSRAARRSFNMIETALSQSDAD